MRTSIQFYVRPEVEQEETQEPHRYFSPVLLEPAEPRGQSDGRGAGAAQESGKCQGQDDLRFTDMSLQNIHHNPQVLSWFNGDVRTQSLFACNNAKT